MRSSPNDLPTFSFVDEAWCAVAGVDGADVAQVRLGLLHGFDLMSGPRRVDLSLGAQKLLALLGLTGHPLARDHVAFTLWPDKTEERALGNLRSALWRLRRTGLGVVERRGNHLALGRDVSVDFAVALEVAERVLARQQATDQRLVLATLTAGDVLPQWYDAWIDGPRERLRQVRLHALEGLSHELRASGDLAAALEAGLAAVAAEPMRESAHRAVILAHLAEGNIAEALRQYESYRFTAHTELGILPSPHMEALVETLRTAGTSARMPRQSQTSRTRRGGRP